MVFKERICILLGRTCILSLWEDVEVLQGELQIKQKADKQKKVLELWNGLPDTRIWAMWVLRMTYLTLLYGFQDHKDKLAHWDQHRWYLTNYDISLVVAKKNLAPFYYSVYLWPKYPDSGFGTNNWLSWGNTPFAKKIVFLITTDVFSKSSSNFTLICTQVMCPSQRITLPECLLFFILQPHLFCFFQQKDTSHIINVASFIIEDTFDNISRCT